MPCVVVPRLDVGSEFIRVDRLGLVPDVARTKLLRNIVEKTRGHVNRAAAHRGRFIAPDEWILVGHPVGELPDAEAGIIAELAFVVERLVGNRLARSNGVEMRSGA